MSLAPSPNRAELCAAKARYQSDLAEAEEAYARALESLGEHTRAAYAAERAESHRARAARLRGGAR